MRRMRSASCARAAGGHAAAAVPPSRVMNSRRLIGSLSPRVTPYHIVVRVMALKSRGGAALGIVTAWNYDYNDDSQLNREFVKQFNEMNMRNPDFMSVGGYDGMHLIYETLKKAAGKTDADSLI